MESFKGIIDLIDALPTGNTTMTSENTSAFGDATTDVYGGSTLYPSIATDSNSTEADWLATTIDTLITSIESDGGIVTDRIVDPPVKMLKFTSACAFIIAILGTIGNIITILALLNCKKLRTPTTAYVINLAVAELLFCLLILPVSGIQYAYLGAWNEPWMRDTACNYFTVVKYTITQAELQTIVAIAITRATAVGYPSLYRWLNTAIFTKLYIIIIWIYSFVLKLPIAIGILGKFTFNSKTMKCDLANDKKSERFRKLSLLVEAIIPVLFIFIVYIYIFIMVRRSSLRVGKSAGNRCPIPTPAPTVEVTEEETPQSPRAEPRSSFKFMKRRLSGSSIRQRFASIGSSARRSSSAIATATSNRRDARLARTIFTIFLVILVCSVPIMVVLIIDSEGKYPVRLLGVHILYFSQYCVNILVYVIMNRQYREAYLDFFGKILPACQRHKGFTFPWEAPSMASKPVQLVPNQNSVKKASTNGGVTGTRISFLNIEEKGPLLQTNNLPSIQEGNGATTSVENDVSEHSNDNDHKQEKTLPAVQASSDSIPYADNNLRQSSQMIPIVKPERYSRNSSASIPQIIIDEVENSDSE